MAGSANWIRGNSTGAFSAHSVSPVSVSRSFSTTPISPGPSASTGFCSRPWRSATCPTRSRVSRVEL
jgi:hypothetical protein